jgi:DNA-binding MarR family transcriptional regulator
MANETSGDVAAAERALERLFRLTANRRMQPKQTAAVGADVTRAGYALLRCLEDGPSTLGDLARACAMDPAATGRQVKLLEDEGLLVRAPSADDARVTVVRMTSDGRKVYRRIVQFRTGYMADVLAAWRPSDRATLSRLVDRLVDDLQSVPIHSKNGRSR